MNTQDIKGVVKEKYGQAALSVVKGGSSCCGGVAVQEGCPDPITSNLYDGSQTSQIPEESLLASLGCGNPTVLAELKPGETVLDLGSGGGIDVLLSAKRVGPSGKAYGLDMTGEMLALARENQRKAGIPNAEFLKGEIENIPLPDNSVDVIISNCVINLSGEKDRVLSESFRVLVLCMTLVRRVAAEAVGTKQHLRWNTAWRRAGFHCGQMAGAAAATLLFRWLVPSFAKDARIVVSHFSRPEGNV